MARHEAHPDWMPSNVAVSKLERVIVIPVDDQSRVTGQRICRSYSIFSMRP
jgi:hypothetical protein